MVCVDLERPTAQQIFVLVVIVFVQAEELCRYDAGCRYSNSTTTFADCSSRNLTVPPCFNKTTDLLDINLRRNKLTRIPQNLPRNLEKLDLSYNMISDNLSCIQMYQELKHFNIDYNNKINTSVSNLNITSNLVFLSLKGNFATSTKYEKGLLAMFSSLFHLRIDGLKNGNFADLFSDDNTTTHSLKILDISGRDGYCNIPIVTATMLAKFNLTHLDISGCGLLFIELRSLSFQQHLHLLDVSHNDRLGFRGLQNISQDLQNSSIKVLKLNKVHCTYGLGTVLSLQHTKYLERTALEELYLDSNRLELMETGVITYNFPKSLKLLSLGDNRLENGIYLLEMASLHNLKIANVSFQSFSQNNYFDFCYEYYNIDSCYVYNKTESKLLTKEILLNYNPIPSDSFSFYLPRNLQIVYANDMKLQYPVGTERIGGSCDLKEIHFQNNFLNKIYGPMSGCENITYVDLSNNFCTHISKHVFCDSPKLEVLNISQNLLGPDILTDFEGEMLEHNPCLRNINLHDNKITELPQNLFANNSMIEIINVSHNKIEHWTIDMRHMHQFQLLDLSYNLIRGLDESSIHLLPAHDQFAIMLQGNPLSCTCENQPFIEWINKFRRSRFPDLTNTTCTYRNGSELLLDDLPAVLQMLRKDCASYSLIIFLASSFICLTTSFIIYRIIYRYRWNILYIYYLTKRVLLPETKSTKRKKNYEFDAFLSYADAERGFVVNMARRLENSGLKICVHDRDFIPGIDIAENITNAIHNSRRIVFVLTSSFVKSYWCMFELNMARIESIYSRGGENIMLLILMEKGVIKEMPRSLLDIVESKSYLEYPDDDSLHCSSVFWKNLGDAMQDKD